jgi:hypothetical protein
MIADQHLDYKPLMKVFGKTVSSSTCRDALIAPPITGAVGLESSTSGLDQFENSRKRDGPLLEEYSSRERARS